MTQSVKKSVLEKNQSKFPYIIIERIFFYKEIFTPALKGESYKPTLLKEGVGNGIVDTLLLLLIRFSRMMKSSTLTECADIKNFLSDERDDRGYLKSPQIQKVHPDL
jgi:hypothetical protein